VALPSSLTAGRCLSRSSGLRHTLFQGRRIVVMPRPAEVDVDQKLQR
jgi:hypothetical protein